MIERNTIHTSIENQRIKLKERSVLVSRSTKFGKEKFKIKNEICCLQKARCCLKLTTMTFDMPMISATI